MVDETSGQRIQLCTVVKARCTPLILAAGNRQMESKGSSAQRQHERRLLHTARGTHAALMLLTYKQRMPSRNGVLKAFAMTQRDFLTHHVEGRPNKQSLMIAPSEAHRRPAIDRTSGFEWTPATPAPRADTYRSLAHVCADHGLCPSDLEQKARRKLQPVRCLLADSMLGSQCSPSRVRRASTCELRCGMVLHRDA